MFRLLMTHEYIIFSWGPYTINPNCNNAEIRFMESGRCLNIHIWGYMGEL